MSDGSDFDQFLDAARAAHAASSPPSDDARRAESSLSDRLSARRPLPATVAAALATTMMGSAAARAGGADGRNSVPGKGVVARSSWLKALAILVPLLGLSASYSMMTPSAPAPAPASATPAAPPSALAPPPSVRVAEPASALATPELVPSASAVLAGPGDLPDAKVEHTRKLAGAHASRADDGTLEAELELLSQVTAALQANQPARALSLIDEHDRRFSHGVLAPEFAAQRAITLAALGRRSEACAQSTAFLAKYPKSPLVPQVRSSCVDPTFNR